MPPTAGEEPAAINSCGFFGRAVSKRSVRADFRRNGIICQRLFKQRAQQLIERNGRRKSGLLHGVGGDADKNGLSVDANQVYRYQAETLVAAATLRAIGRLRFEELLEGIFGVLRVLMSTLVGASPVVAQRQHPVPEVLKEMAKITGANTGVIEKESTLPARLLEQLHSQAPGAARAAFS